jgi:hypothetical protein
VFARTNLLAAELCKSQSTCTRCVRVICTALCLRAAIPVNYFTPGSEVPDHNGGRSVGSEACVDNNTSESYKYEYSMSVKADAISAQDETSVPADVVRRACNNL